MVSRTPGVALVLCSTIGSEQGILNRAALCERGSRRIRTASPERSKHRIVEVMERFKSTTSRDTSQKKV